MSKPSKIPSMKENYEAEKISKITRIIDPRRCKYPDDGAIHVLGGAAFALKTLEAEGFKVNRIYPKESH
jgi:hypothetical protein